MGSLGLSLFRKNRSFAEEMLVGSSWVLAGTWAFRLNKTAWDNGHLRQLHFQRRNAHSAAVSPWSHQQQPIASMSLPGPTFFPLSPHLTSLTRRPDGADGSAQRIKTGEGAGPTIDP
ncbi:hypothetical protein FALCPG4_002825 [Fusarium falciforme]